MESNVIRIIIAEDQVIYRDGLIKNIESFANTKIVGVAENGKELIDLINKHECDLVLTDIEMPIMDGIEATKLAIEKYPELIISAISIYGDELHLQAMLEAGAKGFILKNVTRPELETAINTLHNGDSYFSKELLKFFTDKYIKKNRNPNKQFSEKELDILQLFAQGYSTEETGEKLNLSPHTIRGYKTKLIEKTGSKNIVDLLIYAFKNKLVEI